MNDNNLAYTDKNDRIWLHPSSASGLAKTLNNKHNLKSTLIHEYYHQKELSNGKDYTYSAHAKVYLKQFKHNTFKKNTKDYAEGLLGNFVKYLDNAAGRKEEGWENLVKDFNDSNILGGYKVRYRE